MFVDFEEVQNWYIVTLDGLNHLSTAIHTSKESNISEETLDQIRGMSPHEWRGFLNDRTSEHEMFASLAVLASFEGMIRRDATWRGWNNTGQAHFQRFHANAQDAHVTISKVFELWESEFSSGHALRKQIGNLRRLYADRNVIAHGRAHKGQFAFDLIFPKLVEALRKWREFVPDFCKHL